MPKPIKVGKIQLTPQQTEVLLGIEAWLQHTEPLGLLTGYAGTGKTTILQAMLRRMRQRGDDREVVFTAFSNKATKVLERLAGEWQLEVDAMTCCKLLGLQPQIDEETGMQVFKPDRNEISKVDHYNLIVVDECSMIGQDMWTYLVEGVSSLLSQTKLLFVGDPAQLNPVNEDDSPTFSHIFRQWHLTEVVRYDGAIGVEAEGVRNDLLRSHFPHFQPNLTDSRTKGILPMPYRAWEALIVRLFQSDLSKRDPDYVRVIAYTNHRVLHLNHLIRTSIYGPDCPRFFPGQLLVVQDPCFENDNILMTTSSECEVITVTETDISAFHESWRIWQMKVSTDDGRRLGLRILHESEHQRFQVQTNELAQEKRWREFWNLKQYFHNLRDAYCLTAHKAQGSTFRNVFVDLPNLSLCRRTIERNRLLYVAMTRASHRVFFLQAPVSRGQPFPLPSGEASPVSGT